MNGIDKQKIVKDESAFRGYMAAKMESHSNQLSDIHKRLGTLESWKIKVTAISSTIGAIVGYIASKLS